MKGKGKQLTAQKQRQKLLLKIVPETKKPAQQGPHKSATRVSKQISALRQGSADKAPAEVSSNTEESVARPLATI